MIWNGNDFIFFFFFKKTFFLFYQRLQSLAVWWWTNTTYQLACSQDTIRILIMCQREIMKMLILIKISCGWQWDIWAYVFLSDFSANYGLLICCHYLWRLNCNCKRFYLFHHLSYLLVKITILDNTDNWWSFN